jgi:hypothetical protein
MALLYYIYIKYSFFIIVHNLCYMLFQLFAINKYALKA